MNRQTESRQTKYTKLLQNTYLYVCMYACLYIIIQPTYLRTLARVQQRSQVISRSEHPRARSPGGIFFLKKVDDFFVVALKAQRPPTPLRLFY